MFTRSNGHRQSGADHTADISPAQRMTVPLPRLVSDSSLGCVADLRISDGGIVVVVEINLASTNHLPDGVVTSGLISPAMRRL
jgi:hypothetical protein